MRQMEHWAHRLFPKMPFDEVIERVEKLGGKKEVQTCVKKIRLDMPILDEDFVGSEPEDDVIRNGDDIDEPPANNVNKNKPCFVFSRCFTFKFILNLSWLHKDTILILLLIVKNLV